MKRAVAVDDVIGADHLAVQHQRCDAESGVFSGEKVVLTGTLSKYTRDQASKIIEDLGGEIMSSVSKNTTLVLAGENAGSKLDKANALNIKILSETEFDEMIKR